MNLVKQLDAARRNLAKLEAERQNALGKLAPSLGFASTEELISALQQTLKSGAKTVAKPGPKLKVGRKKRAVITKKTEARVVTYAKRKWTSAKIATELDISVPSVQNIKKRHGLVKARK